MWRAVVSVCDQKQRCAPPFHRHLGLKHRCSQSTPDDVHHLFSHAVLRLGVFIAVPYVNDAVLRKNRYRLRCIVFLGAVPLDARSLDAQTRKDSSKYLRHITLLIMQISEEIPGFALQHQRYIALAANSRNCRHVDEIN